ncbi:MAG: metal-sulfur cluster assembly factor [Bacteroidota bacterium]|nr:metal-sulfur cluster assembly factor [Bacteroidota bacterium]
MAEREAILEILGQILDPELGINIVDLGLIYVIDVKPEGIHICMTMTTPGCPMHESIVNAAERALTAHFPTKAIEVELVWEPPWTLERLSPMARMQLGR